jgi:hypothetical protein
MSALATGSRVITSIMTLCVITLVFGIPERKEKPGDCRACVV